MVTNGTTHEKCTAPIVAKQNFITTACVHEKEHKHFCRKAKIHIAIVNILFCLAKYILSHSSEKVNEIFKNNIIPNHYLLIANHYVDPSPSPSAPPLPKGRGRRAGCGRSREAGLWHHNIPFPQINEATNHMTIENMRGRPPLWHMRCHYYKK